MDLAISLAKSAAASFATEDANTGHVPAFKAAFILFVPGESILTRFFKSIKTNHDSANRQSINKISRRHPHSTHAPYPLLILPWPEICAASFYNIGPFNCLCINFMVDIK